jgi:outer membrane usher protein
MWSRTPYSVIAPTELKVGPEPERSRSANLIEPKVLSQFPDEFRAAESASVARANEQPPASSARLNAAPAPNAARSALTAIEPVRPATAEGAPLEEVWLVVSINGQERAEAALLLRDKKGRLHVRPEDLRHWRLRTPDVASLSHGGENYYPLDALSGLSYQVNESRQSLSLNAPAALFEGTVLSRTTGLTVPSLPPIGGFLNYDLFALHALGETRGSGLLELGGFGKWGAGVSSFLGRDIGGDARYIRLDTTWTRDSPAELASLRLGDAINRAGTWGRPVRFGGVQWATNFATQPGFVTFPLPSLAGEAVLPSTVDLYVNDALRLRREVPSGPFSIPDLPIVTGQGEARLVVRDLLGRERIITQPYYATPRLLQQGLHDYSYELGVARRNYGIASSDYGRGLATGTHRLGFSDRFTGEAHGELLASQRTLGLGAAYLWSGLGLFSGSVAASHSSRGVGALLGAAFERQSRLITFGANTQLASEDFTQLGLQPGELAPKQISQAFASLGAGRYGTFGVNYVHQDYRDRADVQLVSGNYNVTLGKVTFGFSVLRFLSGDERTVAGLTVTLPLDARTSTSLYATGQPGNRQGLLQLQRNLPSGTGVGYRLLAGVGDSDRREAGVSAQNNVGTYTAEASHAGGETAVRGSASGGVAVVGGKAFLSRRIADSFAVVQLPDYPNVRVYADNQLVARTRNDGSALLPRLRAYEKNSISIEQADLPLDAQIDAMQVDAVPYYRSGLVLQFPVKRSRGALITVVLDNREPLPAGAVAQLIGEKEEFPVGMKGEIYLRGLKPANRLRVTWRGQSCELSVPFAETNDPLPDLGTYTCHGVTP